MSTSTIDALLKKIIEKRALFGAGASVAVIAIFIYLKKRREYYQRKKLQQQANEGAQGSKKPKADFWKFYRQLSALIKICIPGIRSKEFGLLVLHTMFLISRTFLSIYVSRLDGTIVKTIVERDPKQFALRLGLWLGIALPATYVNSMIKFLENKVGIALRTRLTKHAYEKYMENETYYRVGNLDSRLSNPDQCLTEDINNFCQTFAHVHSQISKPALDVLLNSWQLIMMSREKGTSKAVPFALLLSVSLVYLTGLILKWARPKFEQLVAKQAELEGEHRFAHSRLITNAEEIAFYRGQAVERNLLLNSYMSLVKHMNYFFKSKIFYVMMEGFLMKYVWSTAGLFMVAIPSFVFEKKDANVTSEVVSDRTASYITAKNLLMSSADAIHRIMLAYKNIAQLAGYTQRVTTMFDVFEEVKQGKYQKQTVTQNTSRRQIDIATARGELVEGDIVKFDGVPIVSPNGDILVESLSFECKPGQHLLITGPNGCGKSSLFRILGGLWPVYGGSVTKPRPNAMFYIPQRPYLVYGTLRDQIIYPDTAEEMKKKGVTDAQLEEILEHVDLVYVQKREGWDKITEWKDVLSGGEKQRLGMARLFYHKPAYAILDECTSAVSIDVEGKMYQYAIDSGITLMTVTHRPTLWKYHNHLLQFDGEGNYRFQPLNAEARMSMKEEKSTLESQLSRVVKMQERLKELCKLLGEDSVVLKNTKEEEDLAASLLTSTSEDGATSPLPESSAATTTSKMETLS